MVFKSHRLALEVKVKLAAVTQTSWSRCLVDTITQSSVKDQNIIIDPGILERINISKIFTICRMRGEVKMTKQ